MTGILIQALSFAYASVGIIATIGYVPTIKDLLHKKMSANIGSYITWTFCSSVTFLYCITMFSDLLLNIVNGMNFACCESVLGLALFVKYSKRGR